MSRVRIVEVGPRDGLQNEKTTILTEAKVRFIQKLVDAGTVEIEATSFVSPKWVPQLDDAEQLWAQLPKGPLYSALVPNLKGLERALNFGVSRIAVFTAASEAFVEKNIGMSLEGSLDVFSHVVRRFRESVPKGWVRGYVSTAFECPYSGGIPPGKVVEVANRLAQIGCDEISIGDTIGVATPREVKALARTFRDHLELPLNAVCWHFHDTNGTAIANVAAALEALPEAKSFDASAGGLGGCPYAPGAGGNLATEDLVYFLRREGLEVDVDLPRLARASLEILEILGRSPSAKAQQSSLTAERSCPR